MQHFALTPGEFGEFGAGRGRGLVEVVEQSAGHPAFPGQYPPHGDPQVAERLIFQVIAVRAELEQPLNIDIVIIGADDQDLHRGKQCANFFDGGERFEIRHGDINEQTVSGGAAERVKQSRTRIDFGDDLDIGHAAQRIADSGAHDGVVIRQNQVSFRHKRANVFS